jgi:hypothetical protein
MPAFWVIFVLNEGIMQAVLYTMGNDQLSCIVSELLLILSPLVVK